MTTATFVEDLCEILSANPKQRAVRPRRLSPHVIVIEMDMRPQAGGYVPLYTIVQGSVYRTTGLDNLGEYVAEVAEFISAQTRGVPECSILEEKPTTRLAALLQRQAIMKHRVARRIERRKRNRARKGSL